MLRRWLRKFKLMFHRKHRFNDISVSPKSIVYACSVAGCEAYYSESNKVRREAI